MTHLFEPVGLQPSSESVAVLIDLLERSLLAVFTLDLNISSIKYGK